MSTTANTKMTRKKLIDALNEDLSREYQAIISYVNYSQVLKGAAYMKIADELAIHATEELDHALKIANHVDYLGGMPSVTPKPVSTHTSRNASHNCKRQRMDWVNMRSVQGWMQYPCPRRVAMKSWPSFLRRLKTCTSSRLDSVSSLSSKRCS